MVYIVQETTSYDHFPANSNFRESRITCKMHSVPFRSKNREESLFSGDDPWDMANRRLISSFQR
jgi:hypothetical protein